MLAVTVKVTVPFTNKSAVVTMSPVPFAAPQTEPTLAAQVQLAEARNLRALRSFGDAELTVEARFASHQEWMETDIEINADDPIEIKASGMMFLRPGGGGSAWRRTACGDFHASPGSGVAEKARNSWMHVSTWRGSPHRRDVGARAADARSKLGNFAGRAIGER